MTAAPDALVIADSAPHAVPVHPMPESAQLTPLFWLSFVTVAVNVCVLPAGTDELLGDTLTPIEGEFELVVVDFDPPPPQPAATKRATSHTVKLDRRAKGCLAWCVSVAITAQALVSAPKERNGTYKQQLLGD